MTPHFRTRRPGARDHAEPQAILGAHLRHGVVVHVLRPGGGQGLGRAGQGQVGGARADPSRRGVRGAIQGAELPLRYKLKVDYGEGGTFELVDPYSFAPTLGELDLHLIAEGRHEELYDKLGAHVRQHEGVDGDRFAVWAPNARAVSVVGDWNSWDGRATPCAARLRRRLGASSPAIGAGTRYKYEIIGADGALRLKADPMAQATELPPSTASWSPTSSTSGATGLDDALGRDAAPRSSEPLSIYEVHLGSWRLTG